jgi:hypothetical protein
VPKTKPASLLAWSFAPSNNLGYVPRRVPQIPTSFDSSDTLPMRSPAPVGDDTTHARELVHLHWLLRGPIRADGLVSSWHHPDREGFPYALATALLLSNHVEILRRDTIDAALRHELTADAAILGHRLTAAFDSTGVVVHRGVRYAFDTVLVAAALDRLAALEPRLEVRSDEQRDGARAFAQQCLLEGRGQEGAAEEASRAKWSLSFAPHLFKLAVGLDPSTLRSLVSRFVAGYWRHGWFRAAPDRETPHPPAHAHALEGLYVLAAADLPVPSHVLEEGLRSLVEACKSPRITTDVLAQTLRAALMSGLPSSDPTVRALASQLLNRAHVDGGFRYSAAADAELNTWATVYALQALRWLRLGADPRFIA